MDAEAEREMLARPCTIDDEVVGVLDRLLVLPLSSVFSSAVRRMWITGVW